jgi:hypothetical protein
MDEVPISSLQGWLIKKKSDTGKKFFTLGSDTKRFFRFQEVAGSEHKELALCYYLTPKDKEARGSIFMKDVIAISDDTKSFTLSTHARFNDGSYI